MINRFIQWGAGLIAILASFRGHPFALIIQTISLELLSTKEVRYRYLQYSILQASRFSL